VNGSGANVTQVYKFLQNFFERAFYFCAGGVFGNGEKQMGVIFNFARRERYTVCM
jgi:hypothetical protein